MLPNSESGEPLKVTSCHVSPAICPLDCQALPNESVLVASFAASIYDISGLYASIDISTRPYVLPGWWNFADPEACRAESLRVTIDFSDDPSTALASAPPWSSQATVSYDVEYPFQGDDQVARIHVYIDDPVGAPLDYNETYYAFKVVFGNPDSGCEGCEMPACLVMNEVYITYSGGIEYPTGDHRDYMLWQGGTYDCYLQTRESTWGRLKGFYR